jgi:phosphoenolpyruvate carboxykinase (GTP)
VGDYISHWLQFGRTLRNPPPIFNVNWFRKDADGKFLWPGFGENTRILKWIVERARGCAKGVESPVGWMPHYEDLDWRGLENFSQRQFNQIMEVDRDQWKQEILSHDALFIKIYDRLPKEMIFIRELMLSALWRSPERWQMAPNEERNF